MQSNITLHIVEPGSTPVDPVVPNTGLFTSGIGGPEATILGITAAVIILAAIVAVLYYRNKKQGKFISLKHKKATTVGLASLAAVVSLGTVAGLLKLGASAIDAQADEAEEVAEVTDGELTIELAEEPVFAVLPVDITVEQATEAGYTLTAFAESTDLVSTTDSSKVIPMIAVDEGELAALADNTYGLTLAEPASQVEEVYTALSTDADNPTLLAEKEEGTEANDTTTIYYGFYITPDTPYGTYTSGDVYYDVKVSKVATVTFDGNGLYFNGDVSQTTNIAKYIPGSQSSDIVYSHTPNVNDEGEQNGKYGTDLNQTFVYSFPGYSRIYLDIIKSAGDTPWTPEGDYFSIWPGGHENYTALQDWDSEDSIKELGSNGQYKFGDYNDKGIVIPDGSMTLAYTTDSDSGGSGGTGYGYYASIMAFNPNSLVSGEYIVPTTTSSEGYQFLGWSTDPNAGTVMYVNANDIANFLDLTDSDVTLYAIWTPAAFSINYDGNGNTAGGMVSDSTALSHEGALLGNTINLYAPNYKKTGYGFVGWSADKDAWSHLVDGDEANNSAIYGPNQTAIVDGYIVKGINKDTNTSTLYAVWAPAEKNAQGNPVPLQDWQGCSGLTPTIYDGKTKSLIVDKNTITALTDNRDGEVYTVARLADGNCWTVENLRLDNSTTYASTTQELSSTNTNNPLLPLTNNTTGSVTSNRLSASSNSWCTNNSASCYDQSIINTNNANISNTGLTASYNASNSSSKWYSYGNNYNWYSVTTGRGTQSVESGTVAGDICPTGWHLPYGGNSTDEKGGKTSGGFYYLNQQMGNDTSSLGSNNWRSFPNNFVYSGFWRGSSAYGRGYVGYYWSSTASNTNYAYRLYFYSGSVNPGTDYSNKSSGFSVRCVAPVQ